MRVFLLPCWEGGPVSGAGAVCPLTASRCRGLPGNPRPKSGSEALLSRPHGGCPPHPGAVVGVEAHVGAVSAGRPRPGVRPGRERVAAVGWGGSAIIRVRAVIHAGPHVHAQTSLGLLLDLEKDKMKILKTYYWQTRNGQVSLKQQLFYPSYQVGVKIRVKLKGNTQENKALNRN